MILLTIILTAFFIFYSKFLFEVWNERAKQRRKHREQLLWEDYWNRIMRESYEREKQNKLN